MVMKANEVKILLQKYYDGMTSPQEEADLENYFLENETGPEFEADRLHFLSVAAMRDEEIPVPDNLEMLVRGRLDGVRKIQGKRSRLIFISVSIAAALILMFSTRLFLVEHGRSHEITDPKIAYAESRQALETVSRYFNEGTAHLSDLGRINQAMEPLGKLTTLDQTVKNLSGLGKSDNRK
jgi:hypothetical protein